MKIKNLEWVSWESASDNDFYCPTPFGDYVAEPAPENSAWDHPYIWGFNNSYFPAKSIEDAKEKANKDFQSNVLRCLDLT